MPLRWIMAAALAGLAVTPPPAAERGPAAAVPGDDLFAAGRFAEATAAYEAAVRDRPDSAAALAALARMRLYQHREDDAAELAQAATARDAGQPLAAQVLRTVAARRAAFAADVYRIDGGAPTAAVDFVTTDPLPVVPVTVEGRPTRFLLDTGAPDIAVRPGFARALGLTVTTGGVGVFAGGKQAEVQQTTVGEIAIGGVRVRHVPAAINPAELPGVPTDGVIGTGLLLHFLATIDYCRGRLVLAPRDASAAFEARAAATSANVVPMWLVGDHFIFARGRINAMEGLFSIDTGLAGGGIFATAAAVAAAGIRLDDAHAGTGQGGGGAVRFIPFQASATLGTLTRDDIPGVAMPEGDPYGIFRFKVAGALSHSFFRHSRVTFDFSAMKLVTEACEA